MFNRIFYTLQAKKALWFTSMIAVAAFTLINATLAPITILGLSLGISASHLQHLLPNNGRTLVSLTASFIALFTPVALTFNIGFLGALAHLSLYNLNITLAKKNTHAMGSAEQKEFELKLELEELIHKLEKKTNVTVSKIKVFDVDAKKVSPRAFAVGGFANNTIIVFSNLMKPPFTRKEKKSLYAHEFGHLKHWDFLSGSATSFLWYTTFAVSLFSVSLPIAIGIIFLSSMSYYAVSQIDELLADCYSAQHSNPKDLISALYKMTNYKVEESDSLWDKAESSLDSFQSKIGMSTHPSYEVRESYLASYAEEKEAAKEEHLKASTGLGI